MANILGLITVDDALVLSVDAVPSAGGGTPATIGSTASYNNGTVGTYYLKTGAADTAWDQVSTTGTSGIINSGTAGRLSLYPTSTNTLSDTYVQNSQNIDVHIVAQPTRTAAIEYTIPNPGDAVTAASFVLTEGAQTINGAKTFGNDVVVNGNLTTNGTLTYVHSTNLQISDPLITLNKGGAAASAGGSGIEFEENAVITAYMKINAAETGFSFKAPNNANFADFLTSLLTATRQITLPDASGAAVIQNASPAGVANQIAFWSNSTTITNPTGTSTNSLYWDSTNFRLGIGNSAPTVALQVTGSARITGLSTAGVVHNDVNGLLSTSAVSLTADVSGILPLANGGTSANLTASAGSIVYSTASAHAHSAAGTSGQALLSGGTGAPTWFSGTGVVHATAGVLSASAVSLTADVSGILPIANGGTNSGTALNNNRIMISSAGSIVEAVALTNGQLLIGSTGAAPVAAAITGTTNQVIVTNAAGSITLSTPQNIHTGATPTFAAETLSGAGAFLDINDTTAATDMNISMATVNTTNATITTIATVTTASNTVTLLKAEVTGIRTGGTAGTAGDSCTYIRTVRVKNNGGTTTLLNLQTDYTSEDQAAFDCTISVSGTSAFVTVRGAANNNMTWKAVITKIV